MIWVALGFGDMTLMDTDRPTTEEDEKEEIMEDPQH